MRNELVVALLVVAAAGCGDRGGEPDRGGSGSGGSSGSRAAGGETGGGGARAGAGGSGGAQNDGSATSLGGALGMSGSAGTPAGAGASSAGSSGIGGAPLVAGAAGSGGRVDDAGAGGAPRGGAGAGTGGTSVASGGSDGGRSGSAGAVGSESGGTGGGAQASCPPGRAAPTPGDSTVMLQHGGRARRYILHVPSGLSAGTPLALVFDLHGAGGNGAQQKGMSGFSSLADKEKFLAIFPDGIDGYWNVDDECCGTAGRQRIDDVGFIRAIITKLRAETCVDPTRIYVSGFSNGGGLAHRMGCDAADVIAAIAPIATDLRTQPCNAVRPISMMEVRGMADSLEPYEGGLVGPEGGQYLAVGAKASLQLWADINQCTGTPTNIDEYCESFTQCGDGVETDLCSLPNVEHTPYNNALRFDIAGVAWKMFKRQPLR